MVLMLLLTGCSDAPKDNRPYRPQITKKSSIQNYKFIKIDNLECLQYGTGRRGGLSCNWEKYNNGS